MMKTFNKSSITLKIPKDPKILVSCDVDETYIPIKEDDYIMKILNRDIVMYFGLITNNIILNWQVVCENMRRYVINQDRYIKCYNRMI